MPYIHLIYKSFPSSQSEYTQITNLLPKKYINIQKDGNQKSKKSVTVRIKVKMKKKKEESCALSDYLTSNKKNLLS